MTINAMMQATVNAPRRSSDRDSHHVSHLHDLANAAIAASRILAPGGERGSLIKARQWVPQEGADDKRDSDDQRQKPICEVGHVLPQRQLLSIIHVEGDQHQKV
jgi:hypothetical protein